MKRKGFTLIELLAVIIILGILMLIAIPSVSTYINESRKNTYVDTAKALVKGTSTVVNGGELELLDEDITYYVPSSCINTENAQSSPYGKFDPAYVIVTYGDDEYNYYFMSRDDSGVGIDAPTKEENLDSNSIKSNIDSLDTGIAIGSRNKIKVYNSDCSSYEEKLATSRVSEHTNTILPSNNCEFTDPLVVGAEYSDGTYTYRYKQEMLIDPEYQGWIEVAEDGWGVILTDPDSTEPITGQMCTTIAGKPIVSMAMTYFYSQSTSVDLSTVDTSHVSNMVGMFAHSLFTSLDVSNFNTSNVDNMDGMFLNSRATSLDLSSFNTSKVTNMFQMFAGADAQTLDLRSFDTSNVTNVEGMFYEAKATSIDVSSFKTGHITSFAYMFGFTHVKHLDLSFWDTSSAIDMSDMFDRGHFESINVSSFDTRNVQNMIGMFYECGVTSLDITNFRTDSLKYTNYMFGLLELDELDLSNFDVSNVSSTYTMFYYTDIGTVYARNQADLDTLEYACYGTCDINFVVK